MNAPVPTLSKWMLQWLATLSKWMLQCLPYQNGCSSGYLPYQNGCSSAYPIKMDAPVAIYPIKMDALVATLSKWMLQSSGYPIKMDAPAATLSGDWYTGPALGAASLVSASRAEDTGFESRLRRDFSGLSHTSDLKIGTPVANLPGAWHHRVSAGTGRPGVSIL